jgi:hypothetical protein
MISARRDVRLRYVFSTSLALTACAVPEPSVEESAIRGGTVDDGDPAVVALSVFGLYSACTATLISHHTLLTAGHCDLSGLEAELGGNADSPTQSIDITRTVVHPMFTAEGKPYDLAVMQLASDPAGIAPIVLNDAPLGDRDVGRMMRHVGFGATDDATGDGSGIKRTVSYALNRIDGMLVYSGAAGKQSCVGDSGGPGLVMAGGAEVLVSVVSDGPDCQLSQDGWDDRVDMVKDWIVETVSGWDAPPTFGTVSDGGGGTGPGGGPGHGSGGGSGNRPGGGSDGAGSGGAGGGRSTVTSGCAAATDGSGGSALWLLGPLAALVWRRRLARSLVA